MMGTSPYNSIAKVYSRSCRVLRWSLAFVTNLTLNYDDAGGRQLKASYPP